MTFFYRGNTMTNDNHQEELVLLLKETLDGLRIDYEAIAASFGQVEKVRQRLEGKRFTLEEHVKGHVYSLLSSNTSWKKFDDNKEMIDGIFSHYSPSALMESNPDTIVKELKRIRCGSQVLRRNINSVPHNIEVISRLHTEIENAFERYNVFDDCGKTLNEYTIRLSEPYLDNGMRNPDKLDSMRIPLVCEYLRNIGISAMKPDRHILRICGSERLGILQKINEKTYYSPKKLMDAQSQFIDFARHVTDDPATVPYLDNLFWLLCAKDYGSLCTKESPGCGQCRLSSLCRHPRVRRSSEQRTLVCT